MDKKISGLTEVAEFDKFTLFPAAIDGSTVAISPATVVGHLTISYSNLQTKVAAKTLVPGRYYRITNPTSARNNPNLAGDVIVRALTTDSFALHGNQIAYVPDYSNTGDYSGVQALTTIAPGMRKGLWKPVTAVLNVSSITGFEVGETVVLLPSNTAVITKIEAGKLYVSDVTANFASGTVQGTRNAASTTASSVDYSGYLSAYPVAQGDIVIYFGIHFQKKKAVGEVAFNPDTDSSAWTPLMPGGLTLGYLQEVDEVEYHFGTDKILARKDRRGNEVRADIGSGIQSLQYLGLFKWGNDNCTGNFVQNVQSYFSISDRVIRDTRLGAGLCTAIITFDQGGPLLDGTYLDRVAGFLPSKTTIFDAYIRPINVSGDGNPSIQIELEEKATSLLLPATAVSGLTSITKPSFSPFRITSPFGGGLRLRKTAGTAVYGKIEVVITFLIGK